MNLRFTKAFACSAVVFSMCLSSQAVAQNFRDRPDPATFDWRDLEKELANKTTDSYTISVTGDLLFQEPADKRISPALREVLASADTTVGNLEGYLVDRQNWAGKHGYQNNWAPKEVAQSLATLGFDIVAPGEADGGPDAQVETMKYLDEVGIKRPGYGPNLSIARQPAFQETEKGRIAMISAFPIGPVASGPIARNKDGNSGGEEAGMNPMRLRRWVTVTPEQFTQLEAMQDSIFARRNEADVARPADAPRPTDGKLSLLGVNYLRADKPGEYKYEMNEGDRQAQILAVRDAKEYSDFVIFTMHIHENRYAYQAYSQDHYPPDYVVELAHELVDNGMDLFFGSGNHTMQGIEIYKGRPIFYNPGNFSVQRFGSDDSPPNEKNLTYIESHEIGDDWLQQEINLTAYVAKSFYQDGKLREIRIYPADLGVDKHSVPWSRSSIAQTPSPEMAQRILTRLQEYSAPFGTKIEIHDGIGIIRVAESATVPVSGGPNIGRGVPRRTAN